MSSTTNSSTPVRSSDREVSDVVFRTLTPFSGTFSPEAVRGGLSGPRVGGPPSTIWRRAAMNHSNSDGFYCRYMCERTGEAMWVPNGEFFVANRPQGVQEGRGSLMDYLLTERRQAVGAIGYGYHHSGRNASSENGNIRRPRSTHTSVMRRPETTRLHRHNPLVRTEPAVAGAGSMRTVDRRERRERVRELHHPLAPTPPTITPPSTSSAASEVVDNSIEEEDGGAAINPSPRQHLSTMIIYNNSDDVNLQDTTIRIYLYVGTPKNVPVSEVEHYFETFSHVLSKTHKMI
ncbi:hypothetical protein I4U23_005738 [Adineta vaga]|nr:hypothetical protein I4U23_005738 [Adineta vaga]